MRSCKFLRLQTCLFKTERLNKEDNVEQYHTLFFKLSNYFFTQYSLKSQPPSRESHKIIIELPGGLKTMLFIHSRASLLSIRTKIGGYRPPLHFCAEP